MKKLEQSITRFLLLASSVATIFGCGKYDINMALSHNAHLRNDLVKVASRVNLSDAIHQKIELACVVAPFSDIGAIARTIDDESFAKSNIWMPIGDESWTLAYRLSGGHWDFIVFLDEPGSLVLERNNYHDEKSACIRAPVYIDLANVVAITPGVTKVILSN